MLNLVRIVVVSLIVIIILFVGFIAGLNLDYFAHLEKKKNETRCSLCKYCKRIMDGGRLECNEFSGTIKIPEYCACFKAKPYRTDTQDFIPIGLGIDGEPSIVEFTKMINDFNENVTGDSH